MSAEQRSGRPLSRVLIVDITLGLLLGLAVLAMTHGQLAMESMGQGSQWSRDPGPPFGPGAGDSGEPSPLPVTAYAGIAAAAVAVMLRRVSPRAALVVASGAVLGFLAAGNSPGPIIGLLAFVLFSAALALPLARLLPWAALAVPAVLAANLDSNFLGLLEVHELGRLIVLLIGLAVAATLGVLVRIGRESSARERATELRRHRYAERLRIAREVHDVVGHSLSVINMQAGVALHVLDKRPEQAEPALQVIRKTSKDALDELRGTLAVFREQGSADHAPEAPLPGLARVEDLAAAVRGEGRTVEVEVDGEARQVSTAVDHAAFRIVQEALTNAVRHASGAAVHVHIRYSPGMLAVEVTDDGPTAPDNPPAEGSGIAGMRERAQAVGGSLQAGPRQSGGFAVRAELPLHQE